MTEQKKDIPNMAPGSVASVPSAAKPAPPPQPTQAATTKPQQQAPPKAAIAVKPIDQFRGALMAMESQFTMVLPPQIKPDKFLRVVMTAVQQTPDLLQADRQTLFNASMKAATDGLIPDGKEAALVVFNTNMGTKEHPQWVKAVQYMPMVAGILKKVRNSGELSSITAHDVYEHDAFEYWVDSDGEHINHRPLMFGNRGALRGTYALAKTKDGAVYIEVMDLGQLDAIKASSRGKGGPWAGAFAGEMRKKSAIRRLAKRLPMSTDVEVVVQRDDDLYDLDQQPEQEQQPVERKSRLKSALEEHEPKDVTPMRDDEVPL